MAGLREGHQQFSVFTVVRGPLTNPLFSDIYQTIEASRTLVLLDRGATGGSASMIPDSTAPPKQKSMELNQQAKGLTLETCRAPARRHKFIHWEDSCGFALSSLYVWCSFPVGISSPTGSVTAWEQPVTTAVPECLQSHVPLYDMNQLGDRFVNMNQGYTNLAKPVLSKQCSLTLWPFPFSLRRHSQPPDLWNDYPVNKGRGLTVRLLGSLPAVQSLKRRGIYSHKAHQFSEGDHQLAHVSPVFTKNAELLFPLKPQTFTKTSTERWAICLKEHVSCWVLWHHRWLLKVTLLKILYWPILRLILLALYTLLRHYRNYNNTSESLVELPVNAAMTHCDIQYLFHLTLRQVAPEPPAQSQYGHTQD